ncbi:hypothetical protein RBSWK_01359 [Rhodopirellula baltica SWK14]|uniref:Uncharacterized protein n=1 Tax=Rhodopirellula baltica SWK14 TaxID=993516 RepID=L7CMJ2_RHOBT|nr:hypothetical protein RBSWK_01359 [Rhodopirellula baltica SWK14]
MIQTSSRNPSQQVFTKTTGNRILLPNFDAIAVAGMLPRKRQIQRDSYRTA